MLSLAWPARLHGLWQIYKANHAVTTPPLASRLTVHKLGIIGTLLICGHGVNLIGNPMVTDGIAS